MSLFAGIRQSWIDRLRTSGKALCSFLMGIGLCLSLLPQAAASDSLTVRITVKPIFNLHDGVTTDTLGMPAQDTDGSGTVRIPFRIRHTASTLCDIIPGSVEYQVNGGGWQAITGALSGDTANLSSAPDMSGAEHELVWASQGDIPDAYSYDVQVRFKVTDGTYESVYGTSPAGFDVDNLAPQGMSGFEANPRRSRIEAYWTAAGTEPNWNTTAHYEVWYGKSQADVESRSGTAQEWDNSDDPDLGTMTTAHTFIAGLDPEDTYYVKIWAIDDYGNEATLDTQQVDTLGTGTVTISTGENNPAARFVSYGGQNVPMVQVKLVVGPAEEVNLTSITFNASGTGHDVDHLMASGVKLYRDLNGNGKRDSGDPQINVASAYGSDDGTVTFSGFSETFSYGSFEGSGDGTGTHYIVVTHDYAGVEESKEQTFRSSLVQASDVSCAGDESAAAIVPSGTFPVDGGVVTLVESGEILIETGANNPPAEEVMNNAQAVPMLQIKLTETSGYENVTVRSVRITGTGTGNEAEDIEGVLFYFDENGDGLIDDGDTHLGTTTFDADDGTAYIDFYPLYKLVPPGGTKHILVTYNLSGSASAAETFSASFANQIDIEFQGRTTQAYITPHVNAGDEFPFEGAEKTIINGRIETTFGPANSFDSLIAGDEQNLQMIQFRISELTGLENIKVNNITFTAKGTGNDAEDLTRLKIYMDNNSNGYIDEDDTHYGNGTYSADDGTVKFTFYTVTIPKGEYKDFLIAYDFNGAASAGETFQVAIESATDIAAKGVLSGQDIVSEGTFALDGAVKTVSAVPSGILYIDLGDHSPEDGNIRNNNTGVTMMQFDLSADSSEDIDVSAITFTHQGTGPTAGVGNLRVYRDENDDGLLDDPGDTLIGQSGTWAGGENTITFTSVETVLASETKHFIVIYDFNGTAAVDTTYRCTVLDSHAVTAQGQTSTMPIAAQGRYILGGAVKTIADRGTVTVAVGAGTPAAGKIVKDDPGAVMLQFSVTADLLEDVDVSAVTVTNTGTADPSADLSSVQIYRDANDDGKLDAGDVLLGESSTWTDGTSTIPVSPAQTVSAAETQNWLVVYVLNGNAEEAETFTASIDSGTAITATGQWSGMAVHLAGEFPVSGSEMMIVPTRAHLRVTIGENTPGDTNALNNATGQEMIQLKLEEFSGYEQVRIYSITFHGAGTGHEVEDISKAVMYEDVNGDGQLDDGDVAIGKTGYYDADDGVLELNFGVVGKLIDPGETEYFLLTYNLKGAASRDETFTATVDSESDISARGRTTGIDIEPEEFVPCSSGTLTIVTADVTVEAGPANPGDKAVCTTATYEPVLQLKLTETSGYERVLIDAITISGTGTGDEAVDVSKVAFFFDENANGIYDDGDTHLGNDKFDADDGKCEKTFWPLQMFIPAGGEKYILVTYDFNGKANENETFRAQLADAIDIELTGYVSKESLVAQGTFPVEGGTITMATDPSGIVYNSLTGEPIDGAVVTLEYENAGSWVDVPAGQLVAPNNNNPDTTNAAGEYNFDVNGAFLPQTMRVQAVDPTGDHVFPSTVISMGEPDAGSHGEGVLITGATNIDIPMDPVDSKVIRLTKEANKDEVVVGDIVTYTLTFENNYGKAITLPLRVRDKLPAGFKYISGSTLMDGQPASDPSGGRIRDFSVGGMAAGETRTLSYQLVVGSGVEPGNYYTNTATVVSSAGTSVSNPASARVKVTYDPIFDLSIIIGKVFHDVNGDGVQQKGEHGIADVKIATEDGLYVVTDKDGKYHIEGLKPQTKLLKVDASTLPEGAAFTTENPRVVRLTSGLLAKVNFGVQAPGLAEAGERSEDAPYLEVKVVAQPTKIEPQLTVTHMPQTPQLSLKGDELDSDIIFKINTNYPDFIGKWKLEIFSTDNRVTPLKTFTGTRNDIYDQIIWKGKDEKGFLVDGEETYIYRITVEDGAGHKDTTVENNFYISKKQTITRTENIDVIPDDFFSNKIATQTIPVERDGTSVVIEGVTDKGAKVTIGEQELGVSETGEFQKELILPVTTEEILVKVVDRQGRTTEYRKKLNLKQDYFFLVALGDTQMGKMKAKGNIDPVRDKKEFRSKYYFDGRMAYYLKAKVKGKYLITSSFDSARERSDLERYIDEDKYYPIYGDSSSVVDDTNTQGKFYILVEWDKSEMTWGNFESDITDVDLAKFNRSLYGGKLYYQSVSTTRYGDPDTILVLFGAESGDLPSHNEFVSTGGSLYYLKNEDVVEGSETVSIEVRDKDTGMVKTTFSAERDADYDIDYEQGRILFYKPVSMIVSSTDLIKNSISLGDPVYVIVDYEYEADEFLEEGTYGGRFAHQLGDHVKIGTTYVKDEKEDGYELKGYDMTVKYGESTELKAEYAESRSTTYANYVSYDGGLTFEDLPSDENLKGNAVKIDLKTDLGELFGKKMDVVLFEAYYQDVSSGFSSQGGVSQQGSTKYGFTLTHNLTAKDTLTFMYDYQKLNSKDNVETLNQATSTEAKDYTLQYKHKEDKYTVTGEYNYHSAEGDVDSIDDDDDREGTSHTVAAKVEYDVDEKTTTYVQQQVTVKGKADNKTIFGVIREFSDNLSMKLEQLIGNRGTATELGIESQVDSRTKMYTNYSVGQEKGEGRTSTTTVGTETILDNDTKVRTEQEYKSTSTAVSASRIIGLEYSKEQWDYDLALEKGEVTNQGEKTERTVIALSADFTEPDLLKWTNEIEFRFDRGTEDKDQFLFQNGLEYKMTSDWTLFSRLEYSRTYNKTQEKIEAEYKELVLGVAYRPVELDRLNMLGKVSYIEDDGPVSQDDDADVSSERAFIFALEGAYDLTRHYQLVEKFAYKMGEEKVGSRDYTKSQTWLWINRLNYHLTSQWDAGVEYRILTQKQAQDSKSGFLCEVGRHLNDNFQVGVGYNFTDFSDDLSEDDDYSTRGFFIRFTGKY